MLLKQLRLADYRVGEWATDYDVRKATRKANYVYVRGLDRLMQGVYGQSHFSHPPQGVVSDGPVYGDDLQA